MLPYDILPFPSERKVIVDAGYAAKKRHIIYGLLEVDVTEARTRIKALKDAGSTPLSFTAFIVACLARAIASDPRVQAYQDWRGRLVVFHEVDVVTLIEPEAGAAAIPHIIRRADRRSVQEISGEIRSIQREPGRSQQRGGLVSIAGRVPRFVRMLFYWAVKKDPQRFKQIQGTAIITSVGMFGKGGGWGIAFLPFHTLGLTVGGIVQRPGIQAGALATREFLNLTLAFDHDIVDGAPAARFARKLIELIESASLLEEGE